MSRTAVIAGAGRLPAAVAQALDAPLVCALDGFTPEGLTPDMVFRVERLVPFFHALEDAGVTTVTFAGAVQRPRLDPALFDAATAALVPRLMGAMAQGDDATLRAVILLFEEAGFAVQGTAQIAPDLVPGAGVLCGAVTAQDEADAARAEAIVAALGAVDVGQGCVVAQGLCLAVEALPGTDAMLSGLVAVPAALRPLGTRGLFYKASKPGQDLRVDLPVIGPGTVARVAGAGLGGIAWQAGGVICLDRDAMITAANDAGLFLWAR
ncbi:MAG: UDP-2,3-diacylglucosamine diphosphatase LpxI [Pseudotabrizicola sp.]|uniref:LpxI family protein n=1 Tax=Pseudotabrizicola sp. TaxID=2939647 RepID=UPI002716A592|nr:UDP-2,3-diacylglucosamine diphosphatase LpxI [Pseudotabrizicola sp.]MDO8882935.1 UDP-2,3-diacylglucosamine diphosphatase LpxI [Pseudotabrizicola sp.]MDP2082756.1 UDP-2,3-diacylglucosamine diphosphatase LpxI [Pseudotabrizicola sp.]MDZ7576271.1 UDP-2,3-diacylglucosamine diphosphatase LpxI [Pseudotabrizicola sp.]